MSEAPKLYHDEKFKKRLYFSNLGIRETRAMRLHKARGLWDTVNGKRDWGNVSEHCLVEVARCEAFSQLLGFPLDLEGDLRQAAALHDFFKKDEKSILEAGGMNWASFEAISPIADDHMRVAGFNERVIHLVNAVGHTSLFETERILAQPELSLDNTAFLVMHYVDDMTVGSNWANPVTTTTDGRVINDVDRRMDKNEATPRYTLFNQEGKTYFNGETAFQAQRRIGHEVEQRLTKLLTQRLGKDIDPINLPEFIDEQIKGNITAY